MTHFFAIVVVLLVGLAGCGSAPKTPAPAPGGGGYYKDDGPGGELSPAELAAIPDAVPRSESLHPYANRPYTALGRSFTPMTRIASFSQRGRASWYGKRYHGQPTSIGEKYDMYKMTGAHPTLPIPSYARVTHLGNGRSVVVRINDRGPFHSDRVIDLSYVAAAKLGYIAAGSAEVLVEQIVPGEEAASVVPSPRPPAPVASGGIFLQLGAYDVQANARDEQQRLQPVLQSLNLPLQVQSDGELYRLLLGPFASLEQARASIAQVGTLSGISAFVVRR